MSGTRSAMIACVERFSSVLTRFSSEIEHNDTVPQVSNVPDLLSAHSQTSSSFLFYVFMNQCLCSLPTAKNKLFSLLSYLPAWLATTIAAFAVRLLDVRLLIAVVRSKRRLSPSCLVAAGLLLSIAALALWLAPITWPPKELPLFDRFWCSLLAIQTSELVLTSLLFLTSSAALLLFAKRFLENQTLVEVVRVAISATLLFKNLSLYMQPISADD